MWVSAVSASNRWTEQGLKSSETVAKTLIFAIAASSLYLLAKPETQQDNFRPQPPGIKSFLCFHPPPVAPTECQKYIKCSISSTEDSQEFRFSGSLIAVLISRTVFETTCFRPPADPTLSASALACCWLPTVETTGRQTSGLDPVHHHRKLSFTSCGPGRTRERRPVRTLLHTTGATSGGSGRRLRFLCNCLQMICTAV